MIARTLLLGVSLGLLVGCGADPEPPAASGGVQARARHADLRQLRDATPEPFAEAVWYVAGDGVYRSPSSTTAPVRVAGGAPFSAPRGIAFGATAQTVYVADPMATGGGALFTVRASDGMVAPVAGTTGYAPTAVDVQIANGVESLVFTGADPMTRQPGVFRVATTAGATPEALHRGAPFARPDGVYVGAQTTWVCDARAATGERGAVFALNASGAPTMIAQGFIAGDPCGISAPLGDASLMVSVVSEAPSHSQVLLVNTTTRETSRFEEYIRMHSGSGGLHRARYSNQFAWAGYLGDLSPLIDVFIDALNPGTGRFNGASCTCPSSSRSACRNAGGSAAFCGACC